MRDGVAHLGSNQQGHRRGPRKLLRAPGASAHEEDSQLTDWLERVGTINAIAAILEADLKQQKEAGQRSAGDSDARALGIEGFGWLSGAMTAAIQQIQADRSQEPRTVSVPMELQVAPVAPLSPNSSTQGQCRWVRVAQLSIHESGSDGDRPVPHHSVPTAADPSPNPQHPSSRAHHQRVKAAQQQQQAHLGDLPAQANAAADSKTTVTGLPVPPASSQLTNPELESKLFSCAEVARELNYQESTIRRCAKKSWLCGPGPYPLRGIPSFYVVTRPNPACGRGHGWKFQRIKATCNASGHSLATQSRGRARHNKATQSCHRHNTCGPI